jgi:hypothetical protein
MYWTTKKFYQEKIIANFATISLIEKSLSPDIFNLY